MRTTLTIDDDVAAAIERLRRRRNESLKTLINEALRRGLRAMKERGAAGPPFRTKAVSLGRCRVGIDNVAEALAIAEGEHFR